MNRPRVVLDTNIIVSAIIYAGKPRQIMDFTLTQQIAAVVSPILLAELIEVLTKKFQLTGQYLEEIEQEIKTDFEIVYPSQILAVVKNDEDDNRVLEAAMEGKCHYIITGDKHLLDLGNFKGIQILTPSQFLEKMD